MRDVTSGESSPVERWLRRPRLAEDRERYFPSLMAINVAHAIMLREQGLLSDPDAARLLNAIDALRREPERLDAFAGQEDLYFTVESAIMAEAGGEVGGKLHLGRSRNDITATMTRMVLREIAEEVERAVLALFEDLVALAAAHTHTVMPGYTHQRPAQPTTLGHYFSGVLQALHRDVDRLADARERADECPLGAAAFAGTSFAIDRHRTAGLLGFTQPVAHSLDAVASRDAGLEHLSALSLLATTLSRLLQDLYVWSTLEFGFLSFAPALTGGSSIMPQKRNPNVLERARAKAAHVTAAFVDAVMAEKGTGFMHCQDVSVDAVAPVWGAVEQTRAMVEVTQELIASITFNADRLRSRSTVGFTLATDVADELVRSRDIPFRSAHAIVQRAALEGTNVDDPVALAAQLNTTARELGLTSPEVTAAEVIRWLDPVRSVASRRSTGGTAPDQVRRLLTALRTWHGTARDRLETVRRRREEAARTLEETAQAASKKR